MNSLFRKTSIDLHSGYQNYSPFEALTDLKGKDPLLMASQLTGNYSRYRMLETVREYARDMLLARGEYDIWVRRLAEYLLFLNTVTKRPLPEEHDNWLAALQWLISTRDATDLALRLASSGSVFTKSSTELAEWLEQTLKGTGVSSNPEPRIAALAVYGESIANQGKRAKAIVIWSEVLEWHQAHDPRNGRVGAILFLLGIAHREMGHFERSREVLRRALQFAGERDDALAIQTLLLTLAETEVVAENTQEADRLLDQAIAMHAAVGNELLLAWALNHRAHAAQLRGDAIEAEANLHQSLQYFSRSQFQGAWGSAWDHQSLGEVSLTRGHVAKAIEYFARSLIAFDHVGDKTGVSWCLCGLAGVFALNEEPERGSRLWGAGEALRESIECRIAPASRLNRERTVAMLGEQLGETEFVRLTAEGATWSLEQAVEEALKL